jgi:MFS family permease
MRLRPFTGMTAFWLTWLGLLLSFTGSGLTRFGVSVWVFEQTRDPQAFSALLFFATIPLAVGSLIAGPLVDRWNRRTVLIVSNVVASLPTLLIMLLYFTGGSSSGTSTWRSSSTASPMPLSRPPSTPASA